MNYIIAREGWPFIATALAFFIVALVVGSVPAMLILGALAAFVAWFFRNPERVVPEGDDIVVSPADGRVIFAEALPGGGKKISIFMSVLNVHVNRIPRDGVVKKIDYNKGKFLVASKDKASLENEQNSVTITDGSGRDIRFVQIAGLIARRIVCYLKEGDAVNKGERYGLIRFGSRLDVYLPDDFSFDVKVGDNIKGGESVLGRF